jgi:hypothetical protein
MLNSWKTHEHFEGHSMKPTPVTLFMALLVLISAGSLQAHHASKFFKVNEPVWISGRVVSHQVVNPHTRLVLEVPDDSGMMQQWTVEGPRLGRLDLMGIPRDFLVPGETITICGFFPDEAVLDANPVPISAMRQERYIHGHLLVKADDSRWLWGPYGNLETCFDRAQWDSIHHGQVPLR